MMLNSPGWLPCSSSSLIRNLSHIWTTSDSTGPDRPRIFSILILATPMGRWLFFLRLKRRRSKTFFLLYAGSTLREKPHSNASDASPLSRSFLSR